MDIVMRLAFSEQGGVRLLNWLAQENAIIIREMDERAVRRGEEPLPLLYESGVVYRREKVELWSDYLNMLMQGHEDCDALAAARAGELLARGWRAMSHRDPNDPVRYPGDEGYEIARRNKPDSIQAEVFITTRTEKNRPGLYHCMTRYKLNGNWYEDDPSARLGMYDGEDAELSRERMLRRRQRTGMGGIETITAPRERVARDKNGNIIRVTRVA